MRFTEMWFAGGECWLRAISGPLLAVRLAPEAAVWTAHEQCLELGTAQDHVARPLPDHDDRCVGVCARHGGHH